MYVCSILTCSWSGRTAPGASRIGAVQGRSAYLAGAPSPHIRKTDSNFEGRPHARFAEMFSFRAAIARADHDVYMQRGRAIQAFRRFAHVCYRAAALRRLVSKWLEARLRRWLLSISSSLASASAANRI